VPRFYSPSYSAVSWGHAEINKALPRLKAALKTVMTEHDADGIVVRGTSGLVFGFPLSKHFRVLHVQKGSSHGQSVHAIGNISPLHVVRLIFLDDLIDTGGTLKAVQSSLTVEGAEVVAALLYADMRIAYKTCKRDICDAHGIPTYTFS
jgi:adenine/guanine phosphoribosyltransferase-like PRPP-binding protein